MPFSLAPEEELALASLGRLRRDLAEWHCRHGGKLGSLEDEEPTRIKGTYSTFSGNFEQASAPNRRSLRSPRRGGREDLRAPALVCRSSRSPSPRARPDGDFEGAERDDPLASLPEARALTLSLLDKLRQALAEASQLEVSTPSAGDIVGAAATTSQKAPRPVQPSASTSSQAVRRPPKGCQNKLSAEVIIGRPRQAWPSDGEEERRAFVAVAKNEIEGTIGHEAVVGALPQKAAQEAWAAARNLALQEEEEEEEEEWWCATRHVNSRGISWQGSRPLRRCAALAPHQDSPSLTPPSLTSSSRRRHSEGGKAASSYYGEVLAGTGEEWGPDQVIRRSCRSEHRRFSDVGSGDSSFKVRRHHIPLPDPPPPLQRLTSSSPSRPCPPDWPAAPQPLPTLAPCRNSPLGKDSLDALLSTNPGSRSVADVDEQQAAVRRKVLRAEGRHLSSMKSALSSELAGRKGSQGAASVASSHSTPSLICAPSSVSTGRSNAEALQHLNTAKRTSCGGRQRRRPPPPVPPLPQRQRAKHRRSKSAVYLGAEGSEATGGAVGSLPASWELSVRAQAEEIHLVLKQTCDDVEAKKQELLQRLSTSASGKCIPGSIVGSLGAAVKVAPSSVGLPAGGSFLRRHSAAAPHRVAWGACI